MFTMLSIGDPKWVAAVMGMGISRRDLHFDQRLLAPYVVASGCKAYLAFTDTGNGYIIQPVLLTPEGNLRNAYNFGGPMGSHDLLTSKEHVDSLNEWAEKQRIRKQYCTLVPKLAQSQLRLLSTSGINPEFKKQSVIIDLKEQKVRGTTRRLANKAHSAGVTVRDYTYEHLKDFIEIYDATMDRLNAKDHWRFSPKWFEAFARFVKPCLMLAKYEDRFEAGCLIAYSQQYSVAYYHFAGSYNTYPSLGISHQMVLAACEFVKSIGIQYLYLGGGISDRDDDGLLVFKTGFSSDRLPVYNYETLYKTNEKPLERTAGGVWLN